MAILTFNTDEELEDHLFALNDEGQIGERMILMNADSDWPIPVYAHVVSPSGDDVAVAYVQLDPDSGMQHCCRCYECPDDQCFVFTERDWKPRFPVTMWEPTGIRAEKEEY